MACTAQGRRQNGTRPECFFRYLKPSFVLMLPFGLARIKVDILPFEMPLLSAASVTDGNSCNVAPSLSSTFSTRIFFDVDLRPAVSSLLSTHAAVPDLLFDPLGLPRFLFTGSRPSPPAATEASPRAGPSGFDDEAPPGRPSSAPAAAARREGPASTSALPADLAPPSSRTPCLILPPAAASCVRSAPASAAAMPAPPARISLLAASWPAPCPCSDICFRQSRMISRNASFFSSSTNSGLSPIVVALALCQRWCISDKTRARTSVRTASSMEGNGNLDALLRFAPCFLPRRKVCRQVLRHFPASSRARISKAPRYRVTWTFHCFGVSEPLLT